MDSLFGMIAANARRIGGPSVASPPQRLKPRLNSWRVLRGAEAPLFHGAARGCVCGMTELVAMRGPAMLHRVRNKVKVNIDININVKGSGQECPLLTGLTGFARPPGSTIACVALLLGQPRRLSPHHPRDSFQGFRTNTKVWLQIIELLR
jgi:hypothetical protein